MMNANESGIAQSSVYPLRPGKEDCKFYMKTRRCGYREKCRYNHPKEIPPVKFNMPKCKYFLKGYCKHGSDCVYDHSWERDGAKHMRQVQKRHITELSSSPSPRLEKRAKTIPNPEDCGRRKRFGEKLQEHRQVNIEKQRIEAQDNVQEESLRETQENHNEEQRKRDIERQRREARLRTEQIKQTVHFDDAIQIRKLLKELGIIITEGDGF